MGTHLHSRSQAALLPQGSQPALAASSCSSSRLALGRQPRCLQEACELFAAKKLARRVLQAFREAVAARAGLMATAVLHSRRSMQRAVQQRLAIWRAGQQQLALLLRSLVALRLAVCHWRKLVQRRRSKRCMHEKAAQHWQQRGAGGWCCCGTGGLQRGAMLTWHS
jgi:hypothetical protein